METQTRVTQLTNDNNNPVANHFVIHQGDTEYLQSYDSIVVKREGNKVTLGQDWDYSPTTLKHVKYYLGIYLTIAKMSDDYGVSSKDLLKVINKGRTINRGK